MMSSGKRKSQATTPENIKVAAKIFKVSPTQKLKPSDSTPLFTENANGKVLMPYIPKCLYSIKKQNLSKYDPGLVINFNSSNLIQGLLAVNAAQDPALLNRPWMFPNTVYPILADNFQSMVLRYCSQTTTGGVIDNFCIAPNTIPEVTQICQYFSRLNSDSFVQAVATAAGGAIGKVYLFYDTRRAVPLDPVNLLPADVGLTAFQ